MRLRLADAFLKAGKDREAAQVLVDLADDLVRRGQNEKAVALLKKVEQLQRRPRTAAIRRSEEHTSELQSLAYLVCRLLLEKKKKTTSTHHQPRTPETR